MGGCLSKQSSEKDKASSSPSVSSYSSFNSAYFPTSSYSSSTSSIQRENTAKWVQNNKK